MQRNLGANAGMDYAGLGGLLRCVAQRSLRQLAAMAAGNAAGAAAQQQVEGEAAGAPAPALGSRWYHAFRLQRAGWILRDLLAEQERLSSSGCPAGQQPASSGSGSGSGGQGEAPYHAAEAASNRACLQRIERQLQALRLRL